MREPLVSFVMPAYNGEKYIEESVLSILNQDYSNIELIIVDDKSRDDTLEIIRSIDDKRIKLICNEKNRGIAYSLNKAISNSSGEYIALLDDDDVAMRDRASKQVCFLENNSDIDILGAGAEEIDRDGRHILFEGKHKKNPKYIKAMLLFRTVDFCNCSTMIRRGFLEKYNLKYREGYCGMQDYQFFIESSKVGKISSIDDILIKKRYHGSNESFNQINNNFEMRAHVYAEMRRKSLVDSGFELPEKQFEVIDKNFPEYRPPKPSKKDVEELYDVFSDVLRRAKEMKIDYYEELLFFLKHLYTDRLYKSDLFEN